MPDHHERASRYRLSVEITNRSERSMIVYVEPWGDEFEIRPVECIRVDILSPSFRAIPVSHGSNSITVEGWEGTTAEVWKGKDRLN
jgi:hypothetical protein